MSLTAEHKFGLVCVELAFHYIHNRHADLRLCEIREGYTQQGKFIPNDLMQTCKEIVLSEGRNVEYRRRNHRLFDCFNNTLYWKREHGDYQDLVKNFSADLYKVVFKCRQDCLTWENIILAIVMTSTFVRHITDDNRSPECIDALFEGLLDSLINMKTVGEQLGGWSCFPQYFADKNSHKNAGQLFSGERNTSPSSRCAAPRPRYVSPLSRSPPTLSRSPRSHSRSPSPSSRAPPCRARSASPLQEVKRVPHIGRTSRPTKIDCPPGKAIRPRPITAISRAASDCSGPPAAPLKPRQKSLGPRWTDRPFKTSSLLTEGPIPLTFSSEAKELAINQLSRNADIDLTSMSLHCETGGYSDKDREALICHLAQDPSANSMQIERYDAALSELYDAYHCTDELACQISGVFQRMLNKTAKHGWDAVAAVFITLRTLAADKNLVCAERTIFRALSGAVFSAFLANESRILKELGGWPNFVFHYTGKTCCAKHVPLVRKRSNTC